MVNEHQPLLALVQRLRCTVPHPCSCEIGRPTPSATDAQIDAYTTWTRSKLAHLYRPFILETPCTHLQLLLATDLVVLLGRRKTRTGLYFRGQPFCMHAKARSNVAGGWGVILALSLQLCLTE